MKRWDLDPTWLLYLINSNLCIFSFL
jgi:hypothetical protein